ncbi:MAG: hypothetical protein ACXV2C_02295 [Candidatus Bathyarchaeia archaeon]
MRLLGHKNIKNTLIYTQLVTFQNEDYICKVESKLKEASELIEAGYEYVAKWTSKNSSGSSNKMTKSLSPKSWGLCQKAGNRNWMPQTVRHLFS